jgi:hypothetical protein
MTDAQPPRGLLPRLGAALFGERTARLQESLHSTHWLSYLLVVTQSIAVVLVLGHAQIPLLFTADWVVRGIVAAALFVLVASVYAADLAFLATVRRIPTLSRNRQTTAHLEHLLYAAFVMLIEGSTYGVVVATLDRDPQALLSPAPLVAANGPLFYALVVGRVVLLCWSTVQLFIVAGKLPPQLTTLMTTGREIVGAHVERQLAALDLSATTLAGAFRVYAAMSKPPRRVRTWLNGWLVKRDSHREAEEERQAQLVLDALHELEGARPVDVLEGAPLPLPQLPGRIRTQPSWLTDDTRPPTGGGSPITQGVRTPESTEGMGARGHTAVVTLQPVRTDRQAAARAAQAERRNVRISHILEWMREAQAKGRKLSVRTVQSRLQRLERLKKPISESTVQGLMRIAEERLTSEREQQAAQ